MDYTLNLDDYDTPEKVARLSDIDQEFAKALDARPPPSLDLSDIPALRNMVKGMEKQLAGNDPPPSEGTVEIEIDVPLRDGAVSKSVLVYPTNAPHSQRGHAIVVLWHGGGWTMGSPGQVVPRARGLVKLFSCVVLCAEYRLAPEHKFPTGVLDAWDSVLFAANAQNFKPFGLDLDHSKGFIIGGWSAGGNFAAVLAQKALEDGLTPPLTGQFLGWQCIFVDEETVPKRYRHLWFSPTQNAHDPTHSRQEIVDLMRGAAIDKNSRLFSPVDPQSTDGERHVGLPKAFIQVSGMDSLRDDGLVYARILREAGVDGLVLCYPGTPHASGIIYPELKVSSRQGGDTARGFAWMLGLKNDEWDETKADEFMNLSPLT